MSAMFPSHAKVTVDRDGIHVTDDEVLRPGDTLRVPMPFADGNSDPRAAFKQRLADAWRGGDAGKGPYGIVPDPETAYAGLKQRLATAWQGSPVARPPRVAEAEWLEPQRRKYRPGLASHDPGDAADSAGFHFDDDDAPARRDAANAAYVDRIANAWREA